MDEIAKAMLESGRSFNYYNIQHVENFNPNATQVITNYYGDQFVPKEIQQNVPSSDEDATRNPQLSQKSILEYVMRLHPSHVHQEWQDKYQALWKEILELPAVADKIYNPGRQQGTTFNRNLVANILHLLAVKKVLTSTASAKNMAIVLEGDANASVRAQLGAMPPKEMEHAIMEQVESPL